MAIIVKKEPTEKISLAIDLPSHYGMDLSFKNEKDLETALRSIVQSLDEGVSLENLFKVLAGGEHKFCKRKS